MSRSVVRAFFVVLTVAVFVSALIAVGWVILTPSAHDGMQSPSHLARAAFDPEKPRYVWVAGSVVGCHTAENGGVLVYALADEIGSAPDVVFVRYPADGRPLHAIGERAGFSGMRVGAALLEARTDLLRPPL